jgi:hypothetical protein
MITIMQIDAISTEYMQIDVIDTNTCRKNQSAVKAAALAVKWSQ